jgi:hypothetical protein
MLLPRLPQILPLAEGWPPGADDVFSLLGRGMGGTAEPEREEEKEAWMNFDRETHGKMGAAVAVPDFYFCVASLKFLNCTFIGGPA